MPKLVWDAPTKHFYETGVSQGVLYRLDENNAYTKAEVWNGLTAVNASPSGAEETPLYADDIKYLSLRSAEEYGGTIEAYTYPDSFAECDGSAEIAPGVFAGQQSRKAFGFCYKTLKGNETELNDYGYKLHLVYGATCSPSEKAYQTVNDSPEAVTFSWEFTTVPVPVTGHKATAEIVIDSSKVDETLLGNLEAVLFGDDTNDARLPLPDEVISIMTPVTP